MGESTSHLDRIAHARDASNRDVNARRPPAAGAVDHLALHHRKI
jgi:hypothetical protein